MNATDERPLLSTNRRGPGVSVDFFFVAALCAVLVCLATPWGRTMLSRISGSLAASAVPAQRYEVSVILSTEDGTDFEWRRPISRSEFVEAEVMKRRFIARYGEEARKAFARKLGYSAEIFGSDCEKLANARVTGLSVEDHRSSRETWLVRSD